MNTAQTKVTIDEVIKPFYNETQKHERQAKLNWDGAACHWSKETRNYLLSENIRNFKFSGYPINDANGFPPNSQDLHPIEYIFGILDSRVKKRHPETIENLIKIIKEEWNLITLEEIRQCYRHLDKVSKYVINNNGNSYGH